MPTDKATIDAMQCLTKELGHSIVITEGLRTKANRKILLKKHKHAAVGGYHESGIAIDVSANGNTAYQAKILCAASKCGFKRGRPYPKAQVHLDMGTQNGWGKLPDKNTCKCKDN
jgi:hypothetical protein